MGVLYHIMNRISRLSLVSLHKKSIFLGGRVSYLGCGHSDLDEVDKTSLILYKKIVQVDKINTFLTQSFGSSLFLGDNLFFVVVLVLIFLWLLILSLTLFSLYRFHRRVFGETKKEDLKGVLSNYLDMVAELQTRVKDLENLTQLLKNQGVLHVQKVGIVRFNPFKDTGGDHSFTFAILDGNDTGIVISCLHGRDRTRIYAKPVQEGRERDYPLSSEEKEAIAQARKV